MGIEALLHNAIEEYGNATRQYYEMIHPPYDARRDGKNIIIDVDLPGYDKTKKEITATLTSNENYGTWIDIRAARAPNNKKDMLVAYRPEKIRASIYIPIYTKDGQNKVEKADYKDGVLTFNITEEASVGFGKLIDIKI